MSRGDREKSLMEFPLSPVSEATFEVFEIQLYRGGEQLRDLEQVARLALDFVKGAEHTLKDENRDVWNNQRNLEIFVQPIDRYALWVGFLSAWWMLRSQREADQHLPRGPILPIISHGTIQDILGKWWDDHKHEIGDMIILDESHNYMVKGVDLAIQLVFERTYNTDRKVAGRLGMLLLCGLIIRQQERDREQQR